MGQELVACIIKNNILDFHQKLLPVKQQAIPRLLEAQHNLYYALFKAAEFNRNIMILYLVKDCSLETRIVNDKNQTLNCVASHPKTKLLIKKLQDMATETELSELALERENAAGFAVS